MKNFIYLFVLLILFSTNTAFSDDNLTLNAGVSITQVPKTFYGSWRIVAKLDDTNSYGTFKPQSADFWTITRINDTVILENPFTGAKAEITIKTIVGNLIVFSKKGNFDNKILTDTVSIRLDKNKFSGINTLSLESFSPVDGHLLKTETARYIISGEKLSGESVLE